MISKDFIFDRRKKAGKKTEAPVELRITVNRKNYYVRTCVQICPKEWQHRSVINRPDAIILNERLAIINNKTDEYINEIMNKGIAFDIKELKKRLNGNDDCDDDVIEYMKQRILMRNVSEGTRKHYRTSLKMFEKWGKIQSWKDVDKAHIQQWIDYINSFHFSSGTKYNYHKDIKAFIHDAVRAEIISRNPYDSFTLERAKSDNPEYLTKEEICRIENLTFQDQLTEKARDLFLFQRYTGLSYTDAENFDISNYQTVKGQMIYMGGRVKTGVPFIGVLLPKAAEIIEKYKGVPQIENHVYNRLLKVVGGIAGIKTKMHSHLARHTFATLGLQDGIAIHNMQRMLGHANIRQTQRYAKVLPGTIIEEFKKIKN